MPCDTKAREGQTLTERKAEVRSAIAALAAALTAGRARAVIGPQGAVAFGGWQEGQTARVTDACAYRMILAGSNALAKQAIARAEALAGRGVSRQAVTAGHHSHDGGNTWHGGH